LGIDAGWSYPVATNCPLCGGGGKLEIRSPTQAHCRECHFIGDLVELLAIKRSESLEAVFDELRESALVDCDERFRRRYLTEKAQRAKLIELLRIKSGHLRQGVSGAIRAIVDVFPFRVPFKTLQRLTPHIIPLRADDFEDMGVTLPKSASSCLKWWKQYTALAIPCWDGVDLIGFWLLTTKGYNYLRVNDYKHGCGGNGFALVPSFSDDFCVVVEDPKTALLMTLWSMIAVNRPVGFVCPHGMRDNAETYRCGKTVFWSPSGQLNHYIRALSTPGALTLDHTLTPCDPEKDLPKKGNWGQFAYQLNGALHAHQALALYLTDLNVADARPVLSNRPIDIGDQAKIKAAVTGADSKHIEDIFGESLREESVMWDGTMITDAPEGWRVTGKVGRSKLITEAKLHLDQVRPQGDEGEAQVLGTILYRSPDGERVSFNFKENLSRIMANPGRWMQEKVITRSGRIPYVDPGWSKRLFAIAQAFHVPTPVMGDQVYGWSDGKLRMPCFTVDQNNLYANRSLVEGPSTQMPEPLSEGEWESFKSISFCRVVLALLGNLVRTSRDRQGVGIMLTNEPHTVVRLSQALGVEIVNNPSTYDLEEHASDPLPLFTEWTDIRLGQVLRASDGYKNMVLSVDKHTAKLSRLRPDWLHLRVGEQIDYGALRTIFLFLPRLLRSPDLNVDSDMFYRDLADTLATDVGEKCRRHRMNAAAIDLDTHNTYRGGTAATRILEAIFYCVERGEISPTVRDDGIVVVSKNQTLQALLNPIIPTPSIDEISGRLEDARFLVGEDSVQWNIDRTAWDLNVSLVG